MAIELIIQKIRKKEVNQRECSIPTADDLCSHPFKRMEFWVEATLSAAVSISSHIFQRHVETARWAVPQGQHTQFFFPPSTPLHDSTNSCAKFSHKTWPAVHCVNNCLSLCPSIWFGEASPVKSFALGHPDMLFLVSVMLSCPASPQLVL